MRQQWDRALVKLITTYVTAGLKRVCSLLTASLWAGQKFLHWRPCDGIHQQKCCVGMGKVLSDAQLLNRTFLFALHPTVSRSLCCALEPADSGYNWALWREEQHLVTGQSPGTDRPWLLVRQFRVHFGLFFPDKVDKLLNLYFMFIPKILSS